MVRYLKMFPDKQKSAKSHREKLQGVEQPPTREEAG